MLTCRIHTQMHTCLICRQEQTCSWRSATAAARVLLSRWPCRTMRTSNSHVFVASCAPLPHVSCALEREHARTRVHAQLLAWGLCMAACVCAGTCMCARRTAVLTMYASEHARPSNDACTHVRSNDASTCASLRKQVCSTCKCDDVCSWVKEHTCTQPSMLCLNLREFSGSPTLIFCENVHAHESFVRACMHACTHSYASKQTLSGDQWIREQTVGSVRMNATFQGLRYDRISG